MNSKKSIDLINFTITIAHATATSYLLLRFNEILANSARLIALGFTILSINLKNLM